MSLVEDLDQCVRDRHAAEAVVKDLQAREKALTAQVLDRYCPFQEGDVVPLTTTRYMHILKNGGRRLSPGNDGLWHWVIEGTAYDTHNGQAEMVGDNFHCRRTFILSDTDYAALSAEVRALTPDLMLAQAQAKLAAKAAVPLSLGPQERAMLGLFSPDFLQGTAPVRTPHGAEADRVLHPGQRHQALRRLLNKGVIDVPLPGPRTELSPLEAHRRKVERLIGLPDLVPGPRAQETLALLAAPSPAVTPAPARRPAARAPRG
jgi:hypothetical protein